MKQYNDTKTKDPIKLLIVNWITEVLTSLILYIIICFKYCNLCLILQDVKDNIKKSDEKKFHRINTYLSFTWFLINLISILCQFINWYFRFYETGEVGIEIFLNQNNQVKLFAYFIN